MKHIISAVVIISVLSGCMSSYEPRLSAPVKDTEAYANDLALCKEEAKRRQLNAAYSPEGLAKGTVIGGFGLAGSGIVSMTSRDNDDYHKAPTTMVDECMSTKGYAVVKAKD